MGNINKLFSYLARPAIAGPEVKDSVCLVLRHGESLGQIFKSAYKALGDDKIPLTPKGSAQASAAGHIIGKLAQEWNVGAVRILCSAGDRASHTAQEIFKKILLYKPASTLRVEHGVDKQKFGQFDGLFTNAERQAKCGPVYDTYCDELERVGPFHARPPGGESIADVRTRIGAMIEGLRDQPGFYVIVTHGTNALCVESVLTGKSEEWILNHVDTRGNCQVRMIAGNHADGFTAQNVCRDPLAWRIDSPMP
jgi:broad specificity phosphatase PhoE